MVALGCATPSRAQDQFRPTVVLISIDGFRPDYIDRFETPAFDRMLAAGVRAEFLRPIFPTKTFPNHYTIVTGLYAENHGIVANSMYDPEYDAVFRLNIREEVEGDRWYEGEPLWVTVERQGQIAASYFWPGSAALIGGVRPSYWYSYDGSVPNETRVDQVLAWLDLPDGERPTFITTYFSLIDDAGHEFDPESDLLRPAVAVADGLIGRLLDGLASRGLEHSVNVIVVSDHGMSPTSSTRTIALDDFIDLDRVRVVDWNPVSALIPDEDYADEAYRNLQRVGANLQVYRKEEIPERYHYRDHIRIPPIIAVAADGWSISTRDRIESNPERFDGGNHGFDNDLPSMRATFVAKGPAFRRGVAVAPFDNIHIYELIAAILGLDPAPNDGNLAAVVHLLVD